MSSFLDVTQGPGPTIGTFVKLPAVESIELLHLAGFDFIVIDMEHSPLSIQTVAGHLAAAKALDLPALVRIPDHTPAWVGRCLDAGAAGIVAPHVDTPTQAQSLKASAQFEPRGVRGAGSTSRAGGWGLLDPSDYFTPRQPPAVVGQIESETALANAADLIGPDGLDALFIGPADLSISMGKPIDHPDVAPRISAVVADCRTRGIPCGIAVGAEPERAAQLHDAGYAFILVSNDATLLGSAGRSLVDGIRAGYTRA